jgi:hypothetical protein
MARVSIDSLQAAESGSKTAPPKATGGTPKPGKPSGGGLDPKQKMKAVIAVVIIVVAGVVIAWNSGLFEGSPEVDASAPPDATNEEARAFEEAQKREQQQQAQPSGSGTTRMPPMPLGSN